MEQLLQEQLQGMPDAEMMKALLQGYQGQFGEPPEGIEEMVDAVKRAKGQAPPLGAQDAGQEITPEPGYVIKTSDQGGRKVFINVCHSSAVPAPSSWQDGMAPDKVLQALEDLQANQPNADAEAMRFALSCSELQHDTDKQGQPCVAVDCVLNSAVMAAVQRHRLLKAFVNELTLDWVARKHGLELSQQYKLPKMAYKGGPAVRTQHVRSEPKALVADVTHARDEAPSFPLLAAKKAAAAPARSAAGRRAPRAAAAEGAGAHGSTASAQQQEQQQQQSGCWQHEITYEGQPVTHMCVCLELPARCSSSSSSWVPGDVVAEVRGTQLRVTLAGATQQQQQQQQQPCSCVVQLPFAARPEGAHAVLSASGTQLAVQLARQPVDAWVARLGREAPTAFAALPLSAQAAYMELDS